MSSYRTDITVVAKWMKENGHNGERIDEIFPLLYALFIDPIKKKTTEARWTKLWDMMFSQLERGAMWGYQANENPFGRQVYVLDYNYNLLLMMIFDTSRTLSDEENDAFFQVVAAANWSGVSVQEHEIEGNTVLIAKELFMRKQDPAFFKEYAALAGVTL